MRGGFRAWSHHTGRTRDPDRSSLDVELLKFVADPNDIIIVLEGDDVASIGQPADSLGGYETMQRSTVGEGAEAVARRSKLSP